MECKECKKVFKQITRSHLQFKHSMTIANYCEKHNLLVSELSSVETNKLKSLVKIGNDYGKFKRNGTDYTCLICGTQFYVAGWRKETAKYCSDDCQHKGIIGQLIGEKHPRWKGGFTPYPYAFKKIRKWIMERDGFQCKLCGSKIKICVHHIDHNKNNNDPKNLITLCDLHNKKENTKKHSYLVPLILKLQSELYGNI